MIGPPALLVNRMTNEEFFRMGKIPLTRKELEAFAIKALGIRRLALRRMSTLFLSQLLQMNLSGEKRIGEMVDEIKDLENCCRRPPLRHGYDSDTPKRADAWIVFKRYQGINYYLALAKTDDGERSINQRLHDAYRLDFPFLEEKHRLV